MANSTLVLATLAALLLMTHVSFTMTQTAQLNSLPNTVGILLSLSASSSSGEGIDDRTAEDIRTAFTSQSVSTLLNSSSSSSVSQYFFSDENVTENAPIKMLQAINSLYVIKVMYQVANKVQSTNQGHWFRIKLLLSPMQSTLDDFFNQTRFNTTTSGSSGSATGSETGSDSDSESAPSPAIFKFTPIVAAALNVTPSFQLENNPLLSNLTVDNTIENVTLALFQLARMVHVARQISALINITSDASTLEELRESIKSIQRVLYAINALTNYQLVDQITEFDFLPLIVPPKVEYIPLKQRSLKRRSLKRNLQKK